MGGRVVPGATVVRVERRHHVRLHVELVALARALRRQRAALASAGIPALVLPAMRWSADDGAVGRIHDFLRTIR